MPPKFKKGDRVRYIGNKRRGHPIPGREYHITDDARYRSVAGDFEPGDFEPGDFEYRLAAAPENDDPNKYCYIEEKYLVLVNPSKIILG